MYAKPTAFASTNDATFVGRSHKADSLGFGIQNMWSERNHGMDTGPDYNDHWISRIPPTQQTAVDNVAFTESHFRSDQSLPAFFNHRLDPNAHDPGTGLIGINNGDGDNWGAWGGYHRWANLVENAGNWQITAWLESNAVFANDNCPDDHLSADLAVRRPQIFKPENGQTLNWNVKDADTGTFLQAGTTTVQDDDLVLIPQILVFRESSRRVRISINDPSVPAFEPAVVFSEIKIEPNPSLGNAVLSVFSQVEMEVEISACGLDGKLISVNTHFFEGQNRLPLTAFESLPAGFYFVSISNSKFKQAVKWVKM